MNYFYQGIIFGTAGGIGAAIVALLLGYPQQASMLLTPTGAIATGISAGFMDEYRRRQA
jgi:uncharacterized membrane protein